MATAPRSIPIATPKLPGRLVDGLRRAVAEPERHAGAYVKLSASGGVHGESYEFEYRVDAAGRVSGRLLDELKGVRISGADAGARKGAKPASAADSKRFAQAVKAIDIEALMRSDTPSAGFVPDSVVCRLEVSDGEQTATFLFQVEDAPAGRTTANVAEPLRRATDAVWRAASAHFGFDVKP